MSDDENVINFYRPTEIPYGPFSNFSRHTVFYNNVLAKTSEHIFQAMKFEGTQHFNDVMNTKTPGDSAKMGRDRKRPLRKDWEGVKDELMYEICLAKFTQHKDIQKILLETGDATLVEHTGNDSYWGDGGDGSGRNQLGKTLMRVRETIKNNIKN
ncbi:hypothetical protein ACTFIW_001639 [Dictyostelium discoideum]